MQHFQHPQQSAPLPGSPVHGDAQGARAGGGTGGFRSTKDGAEGSRIREKPLRSALAAGSAGSRVARARGTRGGQPAAGARRLLTVTRRHGDGEGRALHLDGVVGVGRTLAGILGEVVAGGLRPGVLVQFGVQLAAVVRRARRGRRGERPRGRLGAVGRLGQRLGGAVGPPPAAEDPVHLVVVLAYLAGVPVLLQPIPGLVVLPLEALDADAALLGGALEAQLGQAARHVPVHMAVPKVAVQRRLHVRLAPDLQQRPRLQIRPQEAPRVRNHPWPAGVTAMAAHRGEGRREGGREGGTEGAEEGGGEEGGGLMPTRGSPRGRLRQPRQPRCGGKRRRAGPRAPHPGPPPLAARTHANKTFQAPLCTAGTCNKRGGEVAERIIEKENF